jgi:hypothetical protein
MKPGDIVWGYSTSRDSETWSGICPTREAAIAEGRVEFADLEEFWIVRGKMVDPADVIVDADTVVEWMGDTAYDNWAENVAEDYPKPTEEAKKELDDFLESWARKHCPLECYMAEGDYECIKVKENNDGPRDGTAEEA